MQISLTLDLQNEDDDMAHELYLRAFTMASLIKQMHEAFNDGKCFGHVDQLKSFFDMMIAQGDLEYVVHGGPVCSDCIEESRSKVGKDKKAKSKDKIVNINDLAKGKH